MVNAQTLVWFDYETFGTHPAWDRPAQFAGVRTDLDLNQIDEPVTYFCKVADDYLPNPHACRVTGLSPQHVNTRGDSEAEFIAKVLKTIGKDGTCSIGYNNIRFDDEFTRHIAFRNFFDAYEHEWKSGNSRWDLLDVVRLTRALRPDGINWPFNEDGTASNRLEHLTAANGIEHRDAHDAMSDVWATLGVARLIKSVQPRLYDYVFTHKDKGSAAQTLNTRERKPCLFVSALVPREQHHIAVILPVCRHPVNTNSVIAFDLTTDPEVLVGLDSNTIASRVYAKSNEIDPADRIRLTNIATNKCPVLVPLNTLRAEDEERLGINRQLMLTRASRLEQLLDEEMTTSIASAMHREWDDSPYELEGTLYSGKFFSSDDKQRLAKLRQASTDKLANFASYFDDPRLDEMLWRYRARNHPDSLSLAEQQKWQHDARTRLLDDDAPWLSFNKYREIVKTIDWPPEELALSTSLEQYADKLEQRLKPLPEQ